MLYFICYFFGAIENLVFYMFCGLYQLDFIFSKKHNFTVICFRLEEEEREEGEETRTRTVLRLEPVQAGEPSSFRYVQTWVS